jgi:3-methylfumaryl-CoA hydratase
VTPRPDTPFADWIGRTSEHEDVVTERLDASFRAIFAPHLAEVPDGAAPLGIHWCLSPAIAPMDALGPDGHPALSRDLPPVPQPRRMWAGGTVETHDHLRVGDRVRRLTTIADVTRKQGRSGELWFVAVDHDYVTERGLAVRERHDIVYREAGPPASGAPAGDAPAPPSGPVWTVETSPTLLFRYSALTFNGHRIHYDLPYATRVEGYDGLVVHGPIQATLLLNFAAADAGHPPARFAYRGLSPAIAGRPLTVAASPDRPAGTYRTLGPDGRVHMAATTGEPDAAVSAESHARPTSGLSLSWQMPAATDPPPPADINAETWEDFMAEDDEMSVDAFEIADVLGGGHTPDGRFVAIVKLSDGSQHGFMMTPGKVDAMANLLQAALLESQDLRVAFGVPASLDGRFEVAAVAAAASPAGTVHMELTDRQGHLVDLALSRDTAIEWRDALTRKIEATTAES